VARRRSAADATPTGPAFLLVPREQFSEEVAEQIERGQELAARPIRAEAELAAARSDFYTWSEYNVELLKRRFTTTEIADEYAHQGGIFVLGGYDSFSEKIADYNKDVAKSVRRLESIQTRVPLFEEAASVRAEPSRRLRAPRGGAGTAETIFIVHGHNEAVTLAVHGFIRDVTDLDPVILRDEPSMGRTLIEKFEGVGSLAAFAVVLLTADDEGRALGDETLELQKRGRQNVVFEFGYFVGALGRPRTVVLYEPGVELPSDVQGLVYIEHDEPGGWKMLLARELKAAGIAVDANRLL
jgi:predicted nucleotide-binding protein